jgi:predicted glutamine amidotransferase
VPAAQSRYLALLAKSRLKSMTVVAHIRRANPACAGRMTANTHPFEREWNGHSWIFAHNSKLPGLADMAPRGTGRFAPMGNTDSERAFCMLLDAIATHIPNGSVIAPGEVTTAIEPVVNELAALGEFNFILCNGDYLFVHAHTRLHVLEQTLYTEISRTSQVLLATAPLTNENWRPLPPGGIRVYQSGMAAG